MALRRLAQQNRAFTVTGLPKSPGGNSIYADPTSLPSTPRNRVSIGTYRSPASTPSISSSVPFDWEAARSRKPPPYATPLQKKGPRRSTAVDASVGTPLRKPVIRKKGIVERITSLPSRIAFEVALFPHNLPLPSSTTSARILGGLMHFIHLCIRISQVRRLPDADLEWENMYRENDSWFDWTGPMTLFLILSSCINAFYVFTRIRLYRLHHRHELVSSPNARLVPAELDFERLAPPSVWSRIRSHLWCMFSYSWRFLLGLNPPSTKHLPKKSAMVQQLEVWAPGQLELTLFSIYSPVHALLWMATQPSNWIIMGFIMVAVGVQLQSLIYWFNTLMKDKEIIAAEVMHEYNEGFVYPRVNPIRKDVAVMTHESEVVNWWE